MEMKYVGEHVRLVPIVRGDNDERGLLGFVIWSAIEQAGDWERIFWDTPPDHRKGDLFDWMSYLSNPDNPATVIMFEHAQTHALAGVIWFNSYNQEDGSVHLHIWTDPAHRGAPTREMGLMATDYAFNVLKVKRIIGVSPYPIIRNFGLRCGYKETERREVVDFNGMNRILYRVERANG
jgi:hypothetical protein